MTREQMYHLYKDILSRYGIVPNNEHDYEKIIQELINVYFNKPKEYI